MNFARDALTYLVGLLAMAMILRNPQSVSSTLSAISRGARSISSVLLAGSTPGSTIPLEGF